MAWEEEMVDLLRVMVNDYDAPRTYSDDNLQRVVAVAAFQVQREVAFATAYAVSVTDATISPDPTEGDGKDDAFVNLVTQKAACIIDRGGAAIAASRAISVRDGGSAVDLRGVFAGKLALLKQGWCAVYQDSKREHVSGMGRVAGAAVMTPFRTYGPYAIGCRREC